MIEASGFRVHGWDESDLGVFAEVTVATACTLRGSPAAEMASLPEGRFFEIEHPSGKATVLIERDQEGRVTAAGTIRTARKLFDGLVFPRPAGISGQ